MEDSLSGSAEFSATDDSGEMDFRVVTMAAADEDDNNVDEEEEEENAVEDDDNNDDDDGEDGNISRFQMWL